MTEAVIVAAARSPIGRANKGSMVGLRPDDLVVQIIRAALEQVPDLDPRHVDDLMMGCAEPAGEAGFNIGRVAAVELGYDHLPGTTVNRFCASSLQTSRMAFHAIKAGEGDAFISAGVETVSRFDRGTADGWPKTRNPVFAEARSRSSRQAARGASRWMDPREDGELPDVYIGMGTTAENVARLCDVSRAEMDHFALRSQHLAQAAATNGFWRREITPVTLPDGRTADSDDSPRAGTTYDGLAALQPAFEPEGRVTAGNSCPLNDGAAALVIMSDGKARDLGLRPMARIVATGVSGVSPEIMGLGPVEASQRALAKANMSIADVDLVEINEAFAAQVLACHRRLKIDMDRLNVNGGAIALGHPFGMTGARLTCTLINSLAFHDKHIGLETMCAAGGMGMAMVIERLA